MTYFTNIYKTEAVELVLSTVKTLPEFSSNFKLVDIDPNIPFTFC